MGTLKRAIRFAFASTLSLLAWVGVGLPGAGASLITFNFEGAVDIVGSALTGTFSTTQTLSGSYTFDSATPDTRPADPTTGLYDGALTALTFTVGGYTGTLGGANAILIEDNVFGRDSYRVIATFSGANAGGFTPFEFELDFIDFTQAAFSSDLLPTTPPDLSRFTEDRFTIFFRSCIPLLPPDACALGGTITSLTLAAPEPSTLALLGAGLVGLTAATLRRRRR